MNDAAAPKAPRKKAPAKKPGLDPKVSALLADKQGVRLDLGCGFDKQPGFLGIDKRQTPAVDLVHDLEAFPWPLPDRCAHTVVLSHVWEHISPQKTLDFMAELHRVSKGGAHIFISAPYGLGPRYLQDPTHCNPSNDDTWGYWDDRHPLYAVYRPEGVFHLISYEVVPVGHDKDFNAVLKVVKP